VSDLARDDQTIEQKVRKALETHEYQTGLCLCGWRPTYTIAQSQAAARENPYSDIRFQLWAAHFTAALLPLLASQDHEAHESIDSD